MRSGAVLAAMVMLAGCGQGGGEAADSGKVTITTDRACTIRLNGDVVTQDVLQEQAGGWHGDLAPQVHFQPSPDTRFACADQVLKVLKDAGVSKMGFVGNEAPAGNDTAP